MAQSSAPTNQSNPLQWLSTLTGRSENGAVISDIKTGTSYHDQFKLRLTVEFDNNHREPERYYRIIYDDNEWECTTPRIPSICKTVLEWLESDIEEPHPTQASI